jgi:thiamine-phosphate pyrophosphorylase
VSVSGSVDEARRALADGADYVGVGAMFSSSTKPDKLAVGVQMLKQVRAVVGDLPIVAIGGIGVDTAAGCVEAGADGVALVSAIFGSDNVRERSAALRGTVKAALENRPRNAKG